MSDMAKYMANPKAYTVKRWLSALLKEKYTTKHDSTVERVSSALITEQDLQDFSSLITELYEIAYRKAVADYQQEFEKMGVKINVVAEKTNHQNLG